MKKEKPKKNFFRSLFDAKDKDQMDKNIEKESVSSEQDRLEDIEKGNEKLIQPKEESVDFKEFRYLERLIRYRLNEYYPSKDAVKKPRMPKINTWSLKLSEDIRQYIESGENDNYEDKAALLLITIAPHLRPNMFDQIIQQKIGDAVNFPSIGGVRGKNFRGFLPTGETALFLLAGDDMKRRFEVEELFNSISFYHQNQVLMLDEPPQGEPLMCGRLILEQEYIDLFTKGRISRPRFGTNFPARLIETGMEWNNLVLPDETLIEINNLMIWINNNQSLRQGFDLENKIKPGYRALFYGPPGTGKTFTASLLGKKTNKQVYKIDLSMVISKYIGETEKNLGILFDKAKNKDWILFFDEADALFGKRTNIRDAHDKYANQEVSYLLQRTEDYPGLVILATNFKSNIDDAFSRRFQSHIYFPRPENLERLKLWQNYIPEKFKMDQEIDLSQISRQYDLTGSNIVNAVQYACLHSLEKKNDFISYKDLREGIKQEYSKEGKVF